jgi:hypothetical protein
MGPIVPQLLGHSLTESLRCIRPVDQLRISGIATVCTVSDHHAESLFVAEPWDGFWQVVYETGPEEFALVRNTTMAVKPASGFSIQTHGHFLELRSTESRQPPEGWPPTRDEAIAMLRGFHAFAGETSWRTNGDRSRSESRITMASDPRLEGETSVYELTVDGDRGLCTRTMPDGTRFEEEWRRLSGPASTPLAGAWESGDPEDLWIYLVTAGHYGVMRTSSDRPRRPAHGPDYTDDETYALWNGFGANAGARLETEQSFDHWPMLGQVAGYEIRKHETFWLLTMEASRFVAVLSPHDEPDDGWRRIG